jgi:uncharacterized membrane protein
MSNRSIVKSLAGLIVVYVAVFFTLAYRRWAYFGNATSDFGFFNNMFWYTLRGRPFYACPIGMSNLGIHSAFLWALLIPVYALFPGVPILIFLQTLFLGLTAIPMYLIARKIVASHATAMVLTTAFLLLPPLVSQNVNQIEEPSFIAVFLLFTFYFYLEQRFGWFLVLAFVSCLGRENVALAIGMFAVYSLLLRREKKWVFAPAILGAVYFWFAMFIVMPHFRQGHEWHVMRMFTYLGNTPASIVGNALTHPGLVISHVLDEENITYFVNLIQPLAWILPFGSLASLLALPDLGINLLADNSALKVIAWHYNVFTGSFLFIGAVYTCRKLAAWLPSRWGGQNYERQLAVALLVLCASHWFLWFYPHQYHKLPYYDSVIDAIERIPPDKSVITSLRIQGHLTSREHYDHLGYFTTRPEYAAQFEYVLLDANDRQYAPVVTQEFFDSFYKNPRYQLIFAENNVFVFHRLGGESDWKYNSWERVR